MEVEQAPPLELGPTEVSGGTLVSLVSTGTEVAIFRGIDLPPYPFHPGYAALFEVETIGSEVQGARPGDVLLCLGPHRAWQLVDRSQCALVPKLLAADAAVFARIIAIAIAPLSFVRARPCQEVLVLGLGLVGSLVSQVFRAGGYQVRAYDPDPARRRLAASLGVDVVDVPNSLTPAPALALECSGTGSGLQSACRLVRKGGEVVMLGVPRSVSTEETATTLLEIFTRQLTVVSGSEWRLPLTGSPCEPSILRNIEVAFDWLIQSRVATTGMARIVSPHEAKHVFESLADGKGPLSFIFDWR